MKNLEILKREIKVLAFDQYGTIVDMQKGLVAQIYQLQTTLLGAGIWRRWRTRRQLRVTFGALESIPFCHFA